MLFNMMPTGANFHEGIFAISLMISLVDISNQKDVLQKHIISVGQNLTLDCIPPRNESLHVWWTRKRGTNPEDQLRAHYFSDETDPSSWSSDQTEDTNNWIANDGSFPLVWPITSIEDSGNYICQYLSHFGVDETLVSYDVRVIGCNCFLTSELNNGKGMTNVTCSLTGYESSVGLVLASIYINETLVSGSIEHGELGFLLSPGLVENVTSFVVNVTYTDATSFITCSLTDADLSLSSNHQMLTSAGGEYSASSSEPSSTILTPVLSSTQTTAYNKLMIIVIAVPSGVVFSILITVLLVVLLKQQRRQNMASQNFQLETGGADAKCCSSNRYQPPGGFNIEDEPMVKINMKSPFEAGNVPDEYFLPEEHIYEMPNLSGATDVEEHSPRRLQGFERKTTICMADEDEDDDGYLHPVTVSSLTRPSTGQTTATEDRHRNVSSSKEDYHDYINFRN